MIGAFPEHVSVRTVRSVERFWCVLYSDFGVKEPL